MPLDCAKEMASLNEKSDFNTVTNSVLKDSGLFDVDILGSHTQIWPRMTTDHHQDTSDKSRDNSEHDVKCRQTKFLTFFRCVLWSNGEINVADAPAISVSGCLCEMCTFVPSDVMRINTGT